MPGYDCVAATVGRYPGAHQRWTYACPSPAPPGDSHQQFRRQDVHRAGADSELLHHRPHRPRQVDAGRPDAGHHRRRRRPRHARPVPGPDGHRARARHHHQGAERAAAVGGQTDEAVRPAPDRHPRPRRLHLRGVARAGGLRGRGAAGRRRPGHRGADAGEPVPGARPRSDDHPGAQQDRPARRRPGPLRRRDRPHHRLRTRRRAAGVRQDRRRCPRTARRGGPADSRRRSATPTRPPGR